MLTPDFAARPLSEDEAARLRRETYRYLGVKTGMPDEGLRETVEDCLRALLDNIVPREVHRVFPIAREDGTLVVDDLRMVSRSLEKNLAGCDQVCLMAATLGPAPDRMVARESAAGRMSLSVVIQAAATALIECWCDRVAETIRNEAAIERRFPRPRFSPGYGDLTIEHQRQLFRILGVEKTIGVTLTESLLMLPTKSVTALVGLSIADEKCAPQGCELCARRTSCAFRRI